MESEQAGGGSCLEQEANDEVEEKRRLCVEKGFEIKWGRGQDNSSRRCQ
jgi:hypothetical protein